MWCNDAGTACYEAALTDLDNIAKAFIEKAGNHKVWLFRGEMGSGKTTFIKHICKALGVTDVMSSPTFSIVNEYRTKDQGKVFHFDFYRLQNEAEAYDIGTEEYFYSGNYCMVEWPDKIPGLIPTQYATVEISTENQTQRTIALSLHDGKEENRI